MQLRPYSFSRLSSFESCPLKFKFTYIDKIKVESSSTALTKGSFIHHFLENYPQPCTQFFGLNESDIAVYTKICIDFINSPKGESIVNADCTIGKELDFGLDSKMNPVNFNNPDALLRGSIDRLNLIEDKNYGTMLHVIDYKSGKAKEAWWQSFKQVQLYVIWLFRNPAFSGIDKIKASYMYVEHNISNDLIMERKYILSYIKEYISDIKQIESSLEFPKKVTKLCDWCDFKKIGLCDGKF